MKVVLFCGGLGTRLREDGDGVPKPMVTIGYRPVLWHVMKYYAHFGHKDFILCLGYRADLIKTYFLNYSECISNDFVLSNGGRRIELLKSDIEGWTITFVDTGLQSNIGQRLKAVRRFVQDEPMFLANYSDGFTDLPLPDMIERCKASRKIAGFVSVKPSHSFHVVKVRKDHVVTSIRGAAETDMWINGGYFVLRREIFDYIGDGEDLVEEPFRRLISEEQLLAYKYEGFWAPMDTFKDKQRLDELYARGTAPWLVWKKPNGTERPEPIPLVRAAGNGSAIVIPSESNGKAISQP
jgi:glucose-1-phosphate cytidylyltransferase